MTTRLAEVFYCTCYESDSYTVKTECNDDPVSLVLTDRASLDGQVYYLHIAITRVLCVNTIFGKRVTLLIDDTEIPLYNMGEVDALGHIFPGISQDLRWRSRSTYVGLRFIKEDV